MLEEQIRLHKTISKRIAQLEEERKLLGLAIMQQMAGNVLNIPGYCVKRYKRMSIKLSIEDARSLNAVKLEEIVDKDKIKMLVSNGKSIPGVSETQFIQISETS